MMDAGQRPAHPGNFCPAAPTSACTRSAGPKARTPRKLVRLRDRHR